MEKAMAGKQVSGEGLSASLAGMSKTQLFDIMSQMKQLIEQNQQQAREILIQNPVLTRALFQAQIMLGMVQPPQTPVVSQNLQQSALPKPQSNVQTVSPLPGQISAQEQTRKQHQNQPMSTVSSASGIPSNLQPSSYPLHPHDAQQPKGHIANQLTQMPLPQVSQLPNIPHHATSQPPALLQTSIAPASNPLQQPMQSTGLQHLPLHPTLPPQLRPPVPAFQHQVPTQMGGNIGFQQSGASQMHHSQPIYHSGVKPLTGSGPLYMQGQLPHTIQGPSQPPYQVGGPHLGPEFNQIGSSNQGERASPWLPGPQESPSHGHLPGPPAFSGQMGTSSQASRASLTPDMEKALLQQVMSLSAEQINQLPPEQRNQVLQLQQMLRK